MHVSTVRFAIPDEPISLTCGPVPRLAIAEWNRRRFRNGRVRNPRYELVRQSTIPCLLLRPSIPIRRSRLTVASTHDSLVHGHGHDLHECVRWPGAPLLARPCSTAYKPGVESVTGCCGMHGDQLPGEPRRRRPPGDDRAMAGMERGSDADAARAREVCAASAAFASCPHRRRSPRRPHFVDWYLVLSVSAPRPGPSHLRFGSRRDPVI
jgi:hypothetical protein